MTATRTDRVGVAGLGRMGAAIARRLIDGGFEVAVWNRSPERALPLAEAGATVHSTPADLSAASDIVITMLTDDDAIDQVYRGSDGILQVDLSGKLIIEMSTVMSETEIMLADDVRSRNGAFVECPVGGTVQTTLAGNLFGFAGGTKEDIARADAVLGQLCRRIEHVGDAGAGASVKLAINLPLATYWQSLGEAYALCRHLGLNAERLVELFRESSGGPNILGIFHEEIAGAFDGQAMADPPFDCDLLRKDLRTMIADAKSRGFDLPLCQRALSIYDTASAAGWGERAGFELGAFWTERGNDLAKIERK